MKKMKALMIILPLTVLLLVPCIMNPKTADASDALTRYLVTFDFSEAGIDGTASYSDSLGDLSLTILPMFDYEIDAIDGDGIEFDKRHMPVDTVTEVEGRIIEDMSAYKFIFNKRVKIHSYTIGYSTGVWNDETVTADTFGNKTPGVFGIGSYSGFSADGPDMYDYGPDSEPGVNSVNHDISDIGIYGESFKIYEDGKDRGNFTIKSITVVVAE